MRRALYDAPPMQSQAICLFALLGIGTLAAAQTPPAQGPSAAATGPRFSQSEEAPNLKGFGDAYSLNEIRIGGAVMTEDEQLARWQAELGAGRARAGAIAGAYLAYRALTPDDCASTRTILARAEELGSDQAAWLLAQVAANHSCGDVDRPTLEKWLKKSVALDYPGAAVDLMHFYGESENPADRAQKYLYARVAAGYWEATKIEQPRVGFDAQALLEMEKTLTAPERTSAEAEAAKLLAQMLKRHERFVQSTPAEFARGDAGGKAAFVAWSLDYRHECQWNLKNNCRGSQNLVYVDVSNKNAEFVSCKLEMRARDFVTGTPVAEPLLRQVLVAPGVTRRLLLGDVFDQPDKKTLAASCAPVPKLADNATAGKCRAKLQGSVDAQQFYPESARNRGTEGDAIVRFWVPPGSDTATDGEIATSSGDDSLDTAAIVTVLSGKYTRECDYGLGKIKISFKLNN
jgi:TonB family protein